MNEAAKLKVIEALAQAARWHHGDKWRYSDSEEQRKAWAEQDARIYEALRALDDSD